MTNAFRLATNYDSKYWEPNFEPSYEWRLDEHRRRLRDMAAAVENLDDLEFLVEELHDMRDTLVRRLKESLTDPFYEFAIRPEADMLVEIIEGLEEVKS